MVKCDVLTYIPETALYLLYKLFSIKQQLKGTLNTEFRKLYSSRLPLIHLMYEVCTGTFSIFLYLGSSKYEIDYFNLMFNRITVLFRQRQSSDSRIC